MEELLNSSKENDNEEEHELDEIAIRYKRASRSHKNHKALRGNHQNPK